MSSPVNPLTPPAPEISVNTPAAEIKTAIQNQPRNPDGTFAASTPIPEPIQSPPPPPPAPVEPTPDNPVIVSDLGNGQFEARYLTGEKFTGTAAEVLANTGKAHVSTKLWAKDQVAQAQIQQPPAPQPPPSPFSDPQEEAVAKYTAGLVAKLLGYGDADQMARALGHIQDSSIDYSSQLTALQFQAKAPDFNPTPDNNQKLFKVITDSGISDAEFGQKTREQQVMLMQQAHAYCVQTGQYQPKPQVQTQQPRAPQPPPPLPGSSSQPLVTGGVIPAELQANPGDSLEVIRQKWEKAAALGLVAPRGH